MPGQTNTLCPAMAIQNSKILPWSEHELIDVAETTDIGTCICSASDKLVPQCDDYFFGVISTIIFALFTLPSGASFFG